MKKIFIIYCIWYFSALLFLIFDGQQEIEAYLNFDKENNKADLENSIFYSRMFLHFLWASYGYLGCFSFARIAIFQNVDDYFWGCLILFFIRTIMQHFSIEGFSNNIYPLAISAAGVFGFFILKVKIYKYKDQTLNFFSERMISKNDEKIDY